MTVSEVVAKLQKIDDITDRIGDKQNTTYCEDEAKKLLYEYRDILLDMKVVIK